MPDNNTPLSRWPITIIGTDWDDDGNITSSNVVCDAYITRRNGPGHEPCHSPVYGMNLAELWANLEEHINQARHESPPHLMEAGK